MAKIGKPRPTEPNRIARELKNLYREAQAYQILKTRKNVPLTRITLASYRQYKKYPWLLKELKEANLDDKR